MDVMFTGIVRARKVNREQNNKMRMKLTKMEVKLHETFDKNLSISTAE